MKFLFLAAMAAVLLVTAPASAGSRRTAGDLLYGSREIDANSYDLQSRARLEKALRDGKAGLVGDNTTVLNSVTSIGCKIDNTYNSAYNNVPGSPTSSNTTTSTCNNTGAVSGSVNSTGSGNISNSNSN